MWHDDASLAGHAGMQDGVAMYKEARAAKSVGAGRGVEPQDIGTVLGGVEGRAGDLPHTAGDRAGVMDGLHGRIILSHSCAAVSHRY